MEENANQSLSKSSMASLGDRFLGALIDWLVVLGISYVLRGLIGWQLAYLVSVIYILIRDALPFLDGQSIGKKVMKTRAIVEDSGAPITNDYKTSLLRNILLCIPIASLVDALFIFGSDRKRIGDNLAKTTVIYD